MRKLLLIFALLAMVASANADPNNLDGGVLIAHHVPELVYTTDGPAEGWCAAYAPYAIGGLGDVIAQIYSDSFSPVLWYVIAAWDGEDKTWCGTEFGFGDYNADLFVYGEFAPCFPGDGLEIPTPAWPGPGEGTAFVVTGDPWMGNYVPVYYFGGYAYSYYGSGTIMLGIDPPTGFVGFSNCEAPPASFALMADQLGGMGIMEDGYVPVFPVEEAYVCCYDEGGCEVLLEGECLSTGGMFRPDLGQSCDPNPCPQPTYVCCFPDGGCALFETEEECMQLGGEWRPDLGRLCDPNPCPQPAVCCVLHVCHIVYSEGECMELEGYYHPEYTECDPNPCEPYTPADDASWGSIKALYR